MGLNSHLLFAILSSAVGSGFQHGYNTGVINAPQVLLQNFIIDTYFERNASFPTEDEVNMIFSIIVAIFTLGGMVGALLSQPVSYYLGRKVGLLGNNALVFVAAGLETFSKAAKSYEMIIIGRFIIGINCGVNAALTPMYLTEISPIKMRGAVGTVYQLIITITILLSQIFGLPAIGGTKERWPILFGITIIPAILMLATFIFCPESPRYLLNKGKNDKAEEALKWLLKTESIQQDLDDIRSEIENEKNAPKVTLWEMLSKEVLRKPLIVAIVMMIAQQFSGITAVLYFSTMIFKDSGLSEKNALYATIGVGVVNVVMTVISMGLVEYAGRKTLLLAGMAGMAVLSLILTISIGLKEVIGGMEYASIACVVGFVIMFASGLGSIPWFLVSELFSLNARSLATSIAVAVNWLANFCVGIAFLPLATQLENYVFLIFTVLLLLFCLFVYMQVPETKGRTIEEITSEFCLKTK